VARIESNGGYQSDGRALSRWVECQAFVNAITILELDPADLERVQILCVVVMKASRRRHRASVALPSTGISATCGLTPVSPRSPPSCRCPACGMRQIARCHGETRRNVAPGGSMPTARSLPGLRDATYRPVSR
jgi:hypothetical protein